MKRNYTLLSPPLPNPNQLDSLTSPLFTQSPSLPLSSPKFLPPVSPHCSSTSYRCNNLFVMLKMHPT